MPRIGSGPFMPHHCRSRGAALAGLAMALCLCVSQASAAPEAAPAARVKLGPLGDRPRSGGKVSLRLAPPTVRIGLSGDGRSVGLESSGGLYIVDRDTGRDVWKHLHRGPVRVVLDRGGAPEPQSIFRVQVASLASQEEAEALKSRLEAAGLKLSTRADESSSGPASFTLADPDGNQVLFDQHVPKPK